MCIRKTEKKTKTYLNLVIFSIVILFYFFLNYWIICQNEKNKIIFYVSKYKIHFGFSFSNRSKMENTEFCRQMHVSDEWTHFVWETPLRLVYVSVDKMKLIENHDQNENEKKRNFICNLRKISWKNAIRIQRCKQRKWMKKENIFV